METTVNCTEEQDGYACICVSGKCKEVEAEVATRIKSGWEVTDKKELFGEVYVYLTK